MSHGRHRLSLGHVFRRRVGVVLRRLLGMPTPRLVVAVLALGLVIVPLGFIRADATAPGQPGTPQAGTAVYQEDFENGITNSATGAESYSAAGSTAYVGASGETYTGSPSWINGTRCNGVILSYANTTTPTWAQSGTGATANRCADAAGVRSYQFLRMLALAMGQQFTPGSPTTDHVNSSYTECPSTSSGGSTCDTLPSGQTNGVMFRTTTPIPVTVGHYYAFHVDTAYMNCGIAGADPSYQFAWIDATNGVHTIGSPLNGCQPTTSPNVKTYTQSVTSNVGGDFGTVTKTVRINSLTTDVAFQATASTLNLEMWNNDGATGGNDGAFDNVSLVDVTPQLDKSFSPSTIQTGGTSTLTLTVTNTSELNAKQDWSISDALPTGLTIASTPAVGGTCAASSTVGTPYTVTAPAGGGTLTVVGGDLSSGQASCTIAVNVTSAVAGTYTNGPSNITTNLNPPADATLTVLPPKVNIAKTAGSVTGPDANGVYTATYTVAVQNAGVGTSAYGPLVDTPSFDGSYTVQGGSWTGQNSGSATGPGPFTLASAGTSIPAGATQTYAVSIRFTHIGTGVPSTCASVGTGLYNAASGSGETESTADNSACLPPPASVNVTKTAGTVSGPDASGNYAATYTVKVANNSPTAGTYGALTDTPAFSPNLTPTAATWATSGTGAPTGGSAVGAGPYTLAPASTPIAANTTHTYAVTVTFHFANQSNASPCGSSGTGLFNSVALPAGQESNINDNTACDTPPSARFDVFLRKVGSGSSGTSSLDGSSWALQSDAAGSPGVTIANGVAPVAGQTGEFEMAGLVSGSYWLTETTAPSGHALLARPIPFTVTPSGSVTLGSDTGSGVTVGVTSSGQPQITVDDVAALSLPLTGGRGAKMFSVGGAGLLLLAGIVTALLRRRRN